MLLFLIILGIVAILLIGGFVLFKRYQSLGSLTGEKVYSDTAESPGKLLKARSLNLMGKPDYILKENNTYIPVEVKTGKTPKSPYLNHTMQLMSYCLLVEENYNVRVPGGILRYPENEFKLEYTDDAKNSVRKLVQEITDAKITDTQPSCTHPEHNTPKAKDV